MKQIPVPELIEGKKLLFVDDSIVRGTQLAKPLNSFIAPMQRRFTCVLPVLPSCMAANI